MAFTHTPIPLAHWSRDTAQGRQRTKDLEALTRILLRSVSNATVFDVLSKPITATALIAAGPNWAELVRIANALGPNYTRTEFTEAMDRACRFVCCLQPKAQSDDT